MLVVEDDESINRSLVGSLADAGYEVRGLPDGRELENELDRFRPDLVFLDWMLPGRDGPALSRVVRSRTARVRDHGDRARRGRGPAQGLRRRRGRLRGQAVRDLRAAGPDARGAAPRRRRGRRRAGRRPARRRRRGAGDAGRGRHRPDGDRDAAARVPGREPRPRHVDAADPDPGVGLRRLRRQPRAGPHERAPAQDRGARAAAHPHRARPRLRRCERHGEPGGSSRRSRGCGRGPCATGSRSPSSRSSRRCSSCSAVVTNVALGARLEGELRERLQDRATFATILVGRTAATGWSTGSRATASRSR